MHRSVAWWLSAAYRRRPPEVLGLLVADEAPALALRREVRRLSTRWRRRFNLLASDLAVHFTKQVAVRSDRALVNALKKGGMAVKFNASRASNDATQAIISENVALIRSIPARYFEDIEGMVMRSVSAGRDLKTLSQDLQDAYGVTRRRAALIATHQNNLATGSLQRVRLVEMGIKECIWLHSGGGKHPRPSHVKAGRDKQRFDPATGWFDPDERRNVLPGELINCRCVSRPILQGSF